MAYTRGRRRLAQPAFEAPRRSRWLALLLYPALAPLFILIYGVIFFGVPFLTDAPAKAPAYVPFAFVSGPVAFVPLLLDDAPDRLMLAVLLGGTYALYLAYGLAFRRAWFRGGGAMRVLSLIVVVHVITTFLFVYVSANP